MPDTPQREIEQRLRATAESRRRATGGPFALHPVDRRHLQEEVARTLGAKPAAALPAWRAWLLRHRAALALYSSLALVLVLAAPTLLNFPGQARQVSTPSTDAPVATVPTEPAPVVASPPAPAALPSPELRGADADREAVFRPAPSAPAPASANSATREDIPVKSVAPVMRSARGGGGTERGAVLHDAAPANIARPAEAALTRGDSPAPLERFRVEQRGATLAIVDADGSIYQGLVEPAGLMLQSTASPAATTRIASHPDLRRQAFAAPDRATSPGAALGSTPPLHFQVIGTNLTLQEPVVVTGTLPAPTNPAGQTQQWLRLPAPARASATTATNPPASAPVTNALFNGQLQIGRELPVPFQARPAAR